MISRLFIVALALLGISAEDALQLDDPYRCPSLFIQRVKIANMDVPALIDTGSAACTIDTQLYDKSLAGRVTESGKELVLSADGSSHQSVSFVVPIRMETLESADHARFAVRGTDFKAVFHPSGRLFFRDDKYSNGATELSGIKPGDEIIEIDGDSVDQYTFYSVTDRFSKAGTNLHLKCRRDGKEFEVDLVLKHRYQYPPEWPPEPEEFNPDAVPEN